MKSVHPTKKESGDLHPKQRKEKISATRSRSLKNNFPIFKNGLFNCEPTPWGFNWLLGYCERPNNFCNN